MPATPKLPVKLHEKLGKEAMTDLAHWFADVDARHQAEMARHDAEMKEFRAVVEDLKATDARPELIKWTFVFWLGTVGIVVLLIRFLNHGAG